MKKYMGIIIAGVLLLAILSLLAFTYIKPSSTAEDTTRKKEYANDELFVYKIVDEDISTNNLSEQYMVLPPLSPERFRRRIKMLWGIDIHDYPDNSALSLGGVLNIYYYFSLNCKTQLLSHGSEPDDEFIVTPVHPDSTYSLFRRHLFLNDMTVSRDLQAYKEQCLKVNRWNYPDMENFDITEKCCDLVYMGYTSALFHVNKELYHSIANQNYGLLNPDPANLDVPVRYTDLRLNTILLEIKESEQNKKDLFLGFDNRERPLYQASNKSPKAFLMAIARDAPHQPWRSYSKEKGIAGFLSFLLLLEDRVYNKFVMSVMSGQADTYLGGTYNEWERFRGTIKSNNYYGYAILREFCENPTREMSSLTNAGIPFDTKVKSPDTPLYLEPFPDSYDVDLIQPVESFHAYDMGYDDYYLIKIKKPVESPVTGQDGYAGITDRKEIVYGYIKKTDIIIP